MTDAAPTRTNAERLLFLIAASCVVLSVFLAARLVLSTRTGTIDSYYYFARAASMNDGTPLRDTTLNWGEGVEQGKSVDRKFFPGYPILLSLTSLGTNPERAWRTLAVILVLVDQILLGFALRRVGLSFGAACAAVAMFATSYVPLNWLTMPMAEGTALFWLCLSACALPLKTDLPIAAFCRFALSCLLGGMAIQSRAEAAFPAAAIGVLGLVRIRGKAGWPIVAAIGVALGAAPFAYWVTSLPPAAAGASRLHYVNEFFREFSIMDPGKDGKGGLLGNLGRSWLHPVYSWGYLPLQHLIKPIFSPRDPMNELPLLRAFWILLWTAWFGCAALGLAGRKARAFGLCYLGFIVFRSFWYYPYNRFLVTGLPIGFAAVAIAFELFIERGGRWRTLAWIVFAIWIARGLDATLEYHIRRRWDEVNSHSYRDDSEGIRLRDQLQLTWFPLEGADIGALATRRFTKKFASEIEAGGDPNAKRAEVVALEFPWPQVCYALRPHPIVLGFPLENFWGDAEYFTTETVPRNANGEFVRPPRRVIDFFRARHVRYVITRLPRVAEESRDGKDSEWGIWTDVKGFSPPEKLGVRLLETNTERRDYLNTYWQPRWVRIFEMTYPEPPK